MNAEAQATNWEQAIEFDPSTLSPEAARAIMALRFRESAHARMKHLAERNQEAALTDVERRELELYVHMGDLLTLLQSRARLSLHRAGIAV